MPQLVAVALPPGPDFGDRFVETIDRIWTEGDAFAPIDTRLPAARTKKLLEALAPGAIIEADGKRRSLSGGLPTAEDDAVVVATSGTSGLPKGVVHTHRSVAASALATSKALSVRPDDDKWLACLPLAHIGGLAVVLRSLITGTPVEVHSTFSAEATLDAASRGATLVSLVTRALNQIPAERFRTILVGGAAPPQDRPANVIATYGMTETGSGVIYEKTPLEGLEIRLDEDEILLRGPMLFRTYRNGLAPFEDGWFRTGDMGRWGPDGELVVKGRAGDVIVTGGEKVWPSPIEQALLKRADIDEVALVGRPDPEWGHIVVAVIVSDSPPSLDQIRDYVKEEFGAWCAPKALEVVDAMPKTSLGKIQRTLL